MPLPSIVDEINRLFEELIRRPWGSARQLLPADVREVDDGWNVEFPSHDLREQDIHVDVRGRILTVSAYRRREQQQEGKVAWKRRETEVSLHRTITLPGDVDPENIEAHVNQGTLTLHLHRAAK